MEKVFEGWKRGMLIALTEKNKSGFIDGSTHEPAVGTDLHNAWSRANNMVISWLLNSLSREISASVLYSSTAKKLWAELEARFGQISGAKLFQLQKELSDLVQGSSDIATYYTKMKRLWGELDVLDFFIPCNCSCSCGAKEKNIKSKQNERLVRFLMGLNDSYCTPRGNILMISPLPSIPNAYALLMQEEKQREVQNPPKFPGESSSFIANNGLRSFSTDFKGQKGTYDNKKSNLVCRYCKKTGHSIEKCYKIHEFPADYTFTKSKNIHNSVKINVVISNEFSGDSFLTSAESEEHEKLLTQVQLAQVMQLLQQVKTKDQANNSDVIASANCADIPLSPNHFTLNSTIDGKTFTNETWIID
ncbi:uncharacterized protein LOC125869608 [Solanum stenotomum]|uniref:uncharacterized protein LOC125869608 n=1 Tax=Solanum stenotomum TaxID=172797 RepID=UPI0020CFED55|nr:uncharacterized protein LOC125869608 [Solanum stenotomum]